MKAHGLLREPLLHFFTLGLLLFGVFEWTNTGSVQGPDVIVVDAARIEALRAQFERVWRRQPTRSELTALVDNWTREEVLYREGLALGFDRDDPVLRRRIGQKVEFMSDALVDDDVSDADLEAWFADNAERYRLEAHYTFRQRYFDPALHGDNLDEVVATEGGAYVDPAAEVPGDSTFLPAAMTGASASDVRRTFGTGFADALAGLEAGAWRGPIASGYGMHLVYFEKLTPARMPALDEVRDIVERDLLAQRIRAADEAFYQALRRRYVIIYAGDVSLAARGGLNSSSH